MSRALPYAIGAAPFVWLALHVLDRVIAGLVQCGAAGTCAWAVAP